MSDDLFQDEPSESLHYEKWNVDVVRKFLKEQKIDDDSVDKLCTCTTFQGSYLCQLMLVMHVRVRLQLSALCMTACLYCTVVIPGPF